MTAKSARLRARAEGASGRAGARGWKAGAVTSASTMIVEAVLGSLFQGDLRSGDFLGTEGDLAAAFSVSRLPVRDALRTLQALGLADIRVGKEGGAFVAAAKPDHFARALAVQFRLMGVSFDQLLDAQIVLESALARQAAANAEAGELDALEAILDRLDAAAEGGEDAVELGMAFHGGVARAARNPVLALQLEALLIILHDHYAPTSSPERTAMVSAAHRRLLGLLRVGDAAGAAAHVAAYIEKTRRFGPTLSGLADGG